MAAQDHRFSLTELIHALTIAALTGISLRD
jgi:hypothetical protein